MMAVLPVFVFFFDAGPLGACTRAHTKQLFIHSSCQFKWKSCKQILAYLRGGEGCGKKEKERSLLRDGVRLASCPLQFKSTVHGRDWCFLDHCQPRSHAAGSLKTPELKENEIELTAGGGGGGRFFRLRIWKSENKTAAAQRFSKALFFFPPGVRWFVGPLEL